MGFCVACRDDGGNWRIGTAPSEPVLRVHAIVCRRGCPRSSGLAASFKQALVPATIALSTAHGNLPRYGSFFQVPACNTSFSNYTVSPASPSLARAASDGAFLEESLAVCGRCASPRGAARTTATLARGGGEGDRRTRGGRRGENVVLLAIGWGCRRRQ